MALLDGTREVASYAALYRESCHLLKSTHSDAPKAVVVEDLHKSFGELEVLRGVLAYRTRRRCRIDDRCLRIGQEHVLALHQFPGIADPRADHRYR